MTGQALRKAREERSLTQAALARLLGTTQAYVSLMETGKRPVPDPLARVVARVLDTPATHLPVETPRDRGRSLSNATLTGELARLGYAGFAYLRRGKATWNPAALLLGALSQDDLDARVAEALPWLLLRFDDLDTDWLVRQAKLHDLQNRVGFVVALARQVAERNPAHAARLDALRELERRLERSRLAREDTFGRSARTPRVRAWVRDHRSDMAKHWNVLTDLRTEHLPYVDRDSGTLVELPSGN